MKISDLVRGSGIAFAACALVLTAAPAPVAAHGTTVRVAWSGIRPNTITITTGSTVHFQNVNATNDTSTIVADDGSFQSPALARGEGWHHAFPAPGTFAFHLKEFSGARATVVVVDP